MLQGVANDLSPEQSSEGDKRQTNEQLATARGAWFAAIAEKIHVDKQFITQKDPVVYGKNEQIPAGISYEDCPGVFVVFNGKWVKTKIIDEWPKEDISVRREKPQLGINVWNDYQGMKSINDWRSANRLPLLGWDALKVEYYHQTIDVLCDKLFDLFLDGKSEIVLGNIKLLKHPDSPDKVRVQILGKPELVYMKRLEGWYAIFEKTEKANVRYAKENNLPVGALKKEVQELRVYLQAAGTDDMQDETLAG